ncbi:hypothetical protein LCGC14_0395200 [marine sediment metagenome]|uniref:Uncharacterized protein n=1 Tax=marine sediment metagenome TaxID=412755 RepID=A0A0F9SYC1_9ZZZZ
MFKIHYRSRPRNPRAPFELLPAIGRAGDFLTGGIEGQTISGLQSVDVTRGTPIPARPTLTEKTTPSFKSLPTGIQPVGGTGIVPDQPVVTPEIIQGLIGDVRSPDSRITNLKLPDGLEIGFTPEEALPQGVGGEVKAGDFVGGAKPELDFYEKLGEFVKDPRFAFVTAKLGQAVAPTSPGIQMAGALGSELAVNRSLSEYEQVLKEGGDLTDPRFNIIPSELKQQAIDAKLAGEEFDINKQYKEQLVEESKARAAGTLTVEQRQDVEAASNATRLEIAGMSGKYLNMGKGVALNTRTGDFIRAPNYPGDAGGGIVGNLNSADYHVFNEYTTSTFLPTAMERYREEILAQPGGKELLETKDVIAVFKDPQSGAINFQAVMKYLSDEERIEFTNNLQEYTSNIARGIPPTETFRRQEAERFGPAVPMAPGTQPIDTPEGQYYLGTDGKYYPVRNK